MHQIGATWQIAHDQLPLFCHRHDTLQWSLDIRQIWCFTGICFHVLSINHACYSEIMHTWAGPFLNWISVLGKQHQDLSKQQQGSDNWSKQHRPTTLPASSRISETSQPVSLATPRQHLKEKSSKIIFYESF